MAEATAVTIEPAIWSEPVRGGYPDPRIFGLPGLEQLRMYFRDAAPPPPLHHLTGLLPTHFGPGAATFVMPATPWLLTPEPYISLGVLAIQADASLGCAIQTVLPPATPYTTSDLSLSFLRPLEANGERIAARGRLIHAGRSLGVAEVVIEDHGGRPVAHGTTRCFVLDALDPAPEPPDPIPTVELPTFDTPDPYLREVAGRPIDQEEWDRLTGLEVAREVIAGNLPSPPITHLTGLRPVDAEEGRATFVLPSSGWLTSPIGTVQGGATALLAEAVLATAVQTTLPARTAYSPLDLKLNYLRPVFADGRDLTGVATVTHRGRTMAVADAELRNAEGKLVAVARSSTLIREGHGWHPDEPGAEAEDSA